MKPGGSKGPVLRPRPGGGFNQGLGQFGEHLDENAGQVSAQQKQLAQQQTQIAGTPNPAQKGTGQQPAQQRQPREVGSIVDETIRRPVQDIWQEIKQFFSITSILQIDPQIDSPEEQAKKKQLHSRYEQLTEEQKQVAQKRFQEEQQRKKQQEEEELQKKQIEEQQHQSFVMPSSPEKGPVGPASGKSNKQNMIDKLNMDRQRMSQGQGAG
ncbi:MAG: hypothetical protein GW946_03720 [Candidatus Pacebacteria bacterium]|nr:hypothetical protein [Candidatus Paceibacterota bacterium]PIR60436.1 MAG: hypothetical protein COU67_02280 [Candidatus Pacebacteria bacterium CG10_big_fil_rev_8_21_14_0_10_44_54]